MNKESKGTEQVFDSLNDPYVDESYPKFFIALY